MAEDLTHLVQAHATGSGANLAAWRAEMDGYLVNVKALADNPDPDSIMRKISSIAARLIEIRIQVVRSESRQLQAFRTKELDPFLEHMDLQFKIHSRRLSAMTFDWELSRGQ